MKKNSIIISLLLFGLANYSFAQEIKSGNYHREDGFYKIYELDRIDSNLIIQSKEEKKFYLTDSFVSVSIQRIKKINVENNRSNSEYRSVSIELSDWGKQQFREMTRGMRGEKIGLILNNELFFVASVFGEIGGNITLTTKRNKDELNSLIEKIKKVINNQD